MWRSCGFLVRDTVQNAAARDVRADLAHLKAKADLETHRSQAARLTTRPTKPPAWGTLSSSSRITPDVLSLPASRPAEQAGVAS